MFAVNESGRTKQRLHSIFCLKARLNVSHYTASYLLSPLFLIQHAGKDIIVRLAIQFINTWLGSAMFGML